MPAEPRLARVGRLVRLAPAKGGLKPVQGLSDLFDRVAVSVGEDSLQTIDLILLGVLDGRWVEFERDVRWGLALAVAHGDTVTKEVIRA